MEIERLQAAMTGEERERSRIARELHDGVGGLLSAAKMNLEFARSNVPESIKEDMATSVLLIQEAATELRKVAHNMMPALLLEEGLPKAIKLFCENLSTRDSTKIVFQMLGVPQKLNPAFELHVYRIVQELVHNIIKHAKAESALVQIAFSDDGGLNITVEDNGVGLPENRSAAGMGFKSIAERLKVLNGKMDVESSVGCGTSIYIELEQNQYNYQPV
jgi:signal transduction histidine kinase